jgi:hypothetical protein
MNSITDTDSRHQRKPKTPRNCTGPEDIKPLLVRPRSAWRMLGCGNTRGCELLAAGELDSFRDGRARKITVESIHRYIQRRLEQDRRWTGKDDSAEAAT